MKPTQVRSAVVRVRRPVPRRGVMASTGTLDVAAEALTLDRRRRCCS